MGRNSVLSRVLGGLLTAAIAGLALLAAGCGGGGASGNKVASIATTAATTSAASATAKTKENPAAFSRCMRKHGVTNFPDPDKNGGIRITSGVSKDGKKFGVNSDSPQFRTASQACAKYAPNGGKPDPKAQARQLAQQLAFAKCMRAHGVPKFPDPKVESNGATSQRIGPDIGVDPSSPTFQAAQKTCQKDAPGPVDAGGKSTGTQVIGNGP
jgi:hypothetical protein